MNNEQLKKAFFEVLQKHAADSKMPPENHKDFWAEKLDPKEKEKAGLKKLSGLFLPSVSANYENSKTKIMLVGAETAGWNPVRETFSDISIENYIEKTMTCNAQYFAKSMKSKNQKGRTFFNYLRELDKELSHVGAGYDSGGWVWSNLHCFDWNGKSPISKKALYESFIKPVSKALLQKQIEILKPDFIVFLSGISAAKTRKEFLKSDALPKQNHHESTDYLWEFMVNGHIHCIRTHHPSARNRDAQRALTESQKLLRRLIEERTSF